MSDRKIYFNTSNKIKNRKINVTQINEEIDEQDNPY